MKHSLIEILMENVQNIISDSCADLKTPPPPENSYLLNPHTSKIPENKPRNPPPFGKQNYPPPTPNPNPPDKLSGSARA